jgi:hypothetical protein
VGYYLGNGVSNGASYKFLGINIPNLKYNPDGSSISAPIVCFSIDLILVLDTHT